MSSKKAKSRGKHRAFSLPEMLAIIAIVIIILSLLLPTMKLMRGQGRSAMCRSNLHQQGLGLVVYASESNHYPGAHTWSHNTPGNNWVIWPARVRLFADGQDTRWFWCPDAEPWSQWTVNFGSGLPRAYGFKADEVRLQWNTPFSYGYNNWGTADFAVPQYGLGGLSEHADWGELPKFKVKYPGMMFAVGDAQVDGVWDAFIDHNQEPEYPAARHPNGIANIVFCDGHVEGLELSNILTIVGSEVCRWNNDGKNH